MHVHQDISTVGMYPNYIHFDIRPRSRQPSILLTTVRYVKYLSKTDGFTQRGM